MKEADTEPPSKRIGAVILAAGQGTRMRSALPKVLHSVAGMPMVSCVVRLARQLGCQPVVVVVGHEATLVREALGDGLVFADQPEQLGTGHAVAQARTALDGHVDRVIVLYGDAPLITHDTLSRLVEAGQRSTLALLTARVSDPFGYGRIVRSDGGGILGIVEQSEAEDEVGAIAEVNSGVLCADAAWLWQRLDSLQPHQNEELYLTDLVEMACREGLSVESVQAQDSQEVLGINDRRQLAHASEVLWERKRSSLMAQGVTLLDPRTCFVDSDVQVGPDSVIHPNTYLRGGTAIGRDCEIGPGSLVRDSHLSDGCRVLMSVVEESVLGERVVVGPFAHVRPGSRIGADVELGNFSEVKASIIGAGSKAHHFSYIGDAILGRNVNVGAGSITCNYDGEQKHQTTVGDDVFIGSDTMLVAPIKVGNKARTGAGSVVTRDVGDAQLVVGMPARPVPGRKNARPIKDQPDQKERNTGSE